MNANDTVVSLDIAKANTLQGIAYILYTDKGEFVRQNQACYGELRKYEKTHPGECTQPHNPKPGDLHSPFPEGTPLALLMPFNRMGNHTGDTDAVAELLFSEKSPWVSGFGKTTFFKNDHGNLHGIIINDLNIDPTVLVNLFKTMQQVMQPQAAKNIVDLINEGLEPYEAIAAMMLNSGNYSYGALAVPAYTQSTQFSAKKFFTQRPNDLTGGVLRDRIDYNRTDMHKPFWGNLEDGGIDWTAELVKAGLPKYTYSSKSPGITISDFVPKVKDIFKKALDNEPDPVIEPFNWKTTSGKTRIDGSIISAA